MEILRPMSEDEFLAVEGVGKVKLEKYGSEFINAIVQFQRNKSVVKKEKKDSTYKKTLELFENGISVEEIAERRNISQTTVISHLAKLYVDGHNLDLSQFVSEKEINKIQKAQIELEKPNALKPYFDYFEEKMSYDKIRFGLAIIERKNQTQQV